MRLIILILILTLLTACQAQASQVDLSPRIHLEPATTTLQTGQTARVRVMLDNIKDLVGVEIYLNYDPAILDIQDDNTAESGTQVTLGDLLAPDFVAKNQVEQNTIEVVFLQLSPRQPVAGTGQLIAFSVIARAPGTSALTLETVNLADTDGNPIQVQIEHGQVVVK